MASCDMLENWLAEFEALPGKRLLPERQVGRDTFLKELQPATDVPLIARTF